MKKRLTILLLAGAAAVAGVAVGSHSAVAASQPQSEAEYRAECAAEFGRRRAEEMERRFKEAMASDRSDKERRYASHENRMFKCLRAGKTLDAMFRPEDGLDEFEALLLAKEYFSWRFGVCGWVDLPERRGGEWLVQIASGREARPEPTILIDAQTGVLRCAGHPTVADARGFIHGPKPPDSADHSGAAPRRD